MIAKAKYGGKFWTLYVIGTVCTCGMFVFIMLYIRTMLIDTVDETGVASLSGRTYQWSELTRIERTNMTAVGISVGTASALLFGKRRVIINTALLSNAAEVLTAVSNYTQKI